MGENINSRHLPVILIFSRYFLPGYRAGGPIRSLANLVSALKEKFVFKIVCSNFDHGMSTAYTNTIPDMWQKVGGIDVFYASGKLDYAKIYQETNPDVIYLNSFFDSQFSIFPVFKWGKSKTPIILAPRGEFSDGALEQKKWKKRLFLGLVKITKIYNNIYWHASSEAEKLLLEEKVKPGKEKLFCVSNLPEIKKTELEGLPKKDSSLLKIVLPARISAMKNTLTAIRIVNRLTFPVQFDLWGVNEDVKLWADCQSEIAKSPAHIKISYKGDLVHERLHDVMKTYDVMFMPSLGENFGHSIIEALAAGLPVVISDKTPWRGLESSGVGYDISLNDEDYFCEALTKYHQMERVDFKEIRKKCLDFTKQWKTNSANISLYIKMFRDVMERK